MIKRQTLNKALRASQGTVGRWGDPQGHIPTPETNICRNTHGSKDIHPEANTYNYKYPLLAELNTRRLC